MSVWTLSHIQAFAARHLPDLRVSAARPFTGGFWNDVQHLTTSAGDLVLKRYRPIPPGSLFPNLPQDEALALTRLSGLNVAPDLVGFWPDAQVLIYRHVEGPEWQDDVTAAARLFKRQALADPTGFRAVPTTAAAILAQADAILATCTSRCADSPPRGDPAPATAVRPPPRFA